MDHYDPDVPPNADAWLALDEDLRIILAERYHRDARIHLPKRARRIHATLHTVVENQLALGDDPVVRALERLQGEGLSRHDAVHAIGSVVIGTLHSALHSQTAEATTHEAYYAGIARLTKQTWYVENDG